MDKTEKKQHILSEIEEKLSRQYGRKLDNCSKNQLYNAVCATIRDEIMEKWTSVRETELEQHAKKLYYLSVEFLQGRALGNNLLNLAETEIYREVLDELDVSLESIEDMEMDPGLGNGGLGRLASCFLDSLATLDYPAIGCGIRYEYGLFRQRIIDNDQIEVPDTWLDDSGGVYPWEVMCPEDEVEVHFSGQVTEDWENDRMHIKHVGYSVVKAVPYDIIS